MLSVIFLENAIKHNKLKGVSKFDSIRCAIKIIGSVEKKSKQKKLFKK